MFSPNSISHGAVKLYRSRRGKSKNISTKQRGGTMLPLTVASLYLGRCAGIARCRGVPRGGDLWRAGLAVGLGPRAGLRSGRRCRRAAAVARFGAGGGAAGEAGGGAGACSVRGAERRERSVGRWYPRGGRV